MKIDKLVLKLKYKLFKFFMPNLLRRFEENYIKSIGCDISEGSFYWGADNDRVVRAKNRTKV